MMGDQKKIIEVMKEVLDEQHRVHDRVVLLGVLTVLQQLQILAPLGAGSAPNATTLPEVLRHYSDLFGIGSGQPGLKAFVALLDRLLPIWSAEGSDAEQGRRETLIKLRDQYPELRPKTDGEDQP